MPSPYPAARIAVEDSAWRAFRQAAIVRGIPVSVYLGKLVEAELGRRSETQVGEVDAEAGPRDQAMVALSAVRASIDELDDIAGRLARSAAELGGSWSDVASSLGPGRGRRPARLRPTASQAAVSGRPAEARERSWRYSPAASSASASAPAASETAA